MVIHLVWTLASNCTDKFLHPESWWRFCMQNLWQGSACRISYQDFTGRHLKSACSAMQNLDEDCVWSCIQIMHDLRDELWWITRSLKYWNSSSHRMVPAYSTISNKESLITCLLWIKNTIHSKSNAIQYSAIRTLYLSNNHRAILDIVSYGLSTQA